MITFYKIIDRNEDLSSMTYNKRDWRAYVLTNSLLVVKNTSSYPSWDEHSLYLFIYYIRVSARQMYIYRYTARPGKLANFLVRPHFGAFSDYERKQVDEKEGCIMQICFYKSPCAPGIFFFELVKKFSFSLSARSLFIYSPSFLRTSWMKFIRPTLRRCAAAPTHIKRT